MFQHENTIWSDQFDPSRFELSLDLFAKEGGYKGFSAVCISLFVLVLSMVTESHHFSIPRHLSGLWESSVLSTSSLLLFAAHWKRLLQFLDAELRVFELLPLERNRLDIGTWGRWCFWGLWLFGPGFSYLGGGKRSFCGTYGCLCTRHHRSDIQLQPQGREVIHIPEFSISVFQISTRSAGLDFPLNRSSSSGQASVAPALCGSQPFAAGDFGPAADSAAGPKNPIEYRGAA